MKKTITLLFVALFAISCMSKTERIPLMENVDEVLKRYSTTKLETAPTPKIGHVAIAKLGNEVIGITSLGGGAVSVPHVGFTDHAIEWSEVTLTELLNMDWSDTLFDGILENLESGAEQFSRNGLLMFEDTPQGDCDYNDVIIHIQTETIHVKPKDGQYEISFNTTYQPIALGGALPVRVGFELRNPVTGKILEVYDTPSSTEVKPAEFILCDNARQELFEGDNEPFFLNTKSEHPYKSYKKSSFKTTMYSRNPKEQIAYNWFIEVISKDGIARYYTADAHKYLKGGDIAYSNVLMAGSTPFGIFLPSYKDNKDKNKDFRYMEEFQNIRKGYPEFQDWVDGKIDYPFNNAVNEFLYQHDVK